MALGFIPGSTAATREGLFDPARVIVTSFFNGGLYQVSIPAAP